MQMVYCRGIADTGQDAFLQCGEDFGLVTQMFVLRRCADTEFLGRAPHHDCVQTFQPVWLVASS